MCSDRLFKELLAVIVSFERDWDNGEGSVHTQTLNFMFKYLKFIVVYVTFITLKEKYFTCI